MMDDQIDSLPDDDQTAFIYLEKRFREDLRMTLENTVDAAVSRFAYLEYINKTISAAHSFEIEEFRAWEIQMTHDGSPDLSNTVMSMCDYIRVQVQIKNTRRNRKYSAKLSNDAKNEIREYITKIRLLVDHADIDPPKKDALYEKLGALEFEVDRERMRFDRVMALIIEASSGIGNAVDKLEPIRRWIDSITRLIGVAKQEEDNSKLRLPSPNENRRLDPPQRRFPAPPSKKSHNDDIPF